MPAPKKTAKADSKKLGTKASNKRLPEVKAAKPVDVATTPVVAASKVANVPESWTASGSVAVATQPARTETKSESVRDRTAIAALAARLRDPEADNARDAAITLGGLPRDGEAVAALCDVVRNQDGFFHPVVRAAAAQALGRIGDRSAVEALIEATRDTMAEASEEAVKALGLLGDVRALPALSAAASNADGFYLQSVSRSAAEAIERLSCAGA